MQQGVQSPDWSCLAEQLLVHIFEQQHNALDNCAAACTCTTWRAAVNSSHISSLHLHADQAPYGSHWKHFFASRRSFGHLRLTAGDKSVEGEVANNFGEPSSRSDSLQGIPLACDRLSVDTTFAGMLPQYIQQPAKVKQLAVTWDWNWVNWTKERLEVFAFPSLTHLAELTRLQIQAEKRYGSPPAELIQYNLNRCPKTLERITLDGLSLWHQDDQRSSIQLVLGSAAASLTCLELLRCHFGFGGSGISCLAHLISLSLQGSEVWGDPSDITMLTNLTLLDLSESEWDWPNSGRAPDMLLFTGRSALQVLKLSDCSLFNQQTALHLPCVVDLQLGWVPVSTGSSTLRIWTPCADEQCVFELLLHANLLVELDLSVNQLGSYLARTASQKLAERLGQLLSLCHHLQSFKFIGFSSGGPLEAEEMVIDRHNGACLHRLSLSNVRFRLLDLQNAVSLTSLALRNVDAAPDFTLVLPPWLQSFDFTGRFLFTPQARHVLLECTSLNKLRVVGKGVITLAQCNMPLLPISLRHLDIQTSRADRGWIDCCDWKCLNACTNIESLRLPSPEHLVGYLKAWVHGARHLHIVEFRTTFIV